MTIFDNFSHSSFAKATRVVITAFALLVWCNSSASAQTFDPWNNLSNYFNLNKVNNYGSEYMFNSHDITYGRWTISNEHINEQEYYATVLGSNVWVRRYPQIASHTQLCKVNTGDRIIILGSAGYNDGKHWSRIRLQGGQYAGYEAYICTDFIIDYEMYSTLCKYVFTQRSNISAASKSQYLNAIAAILIKLGANNYSPSNISVTMFSSYSFGGEVVIPFRIYNNYFSWNNSMLAFVKFSNGSNYYQVIGIVPGRSVQYVTRLSNGSYNIGYRM